MTYAPKLKALRERHASTLQATAFFLGLALVAFVGALAHVETAAGVHLDDVHVPGSFLNGFTSAAFPAGEPYDVGRGVGKIVQYLVFIAFLIGHLGSVGLLIWALAKKQKRLVAPSLLVVVVLSVY